MTKRASPKALKALELLNAGAFSDKEIAKRVKCSPSYVWLLRKQMAHKDEPLVSDVGSFGTAEAHVRKLRTAIAKVRAKDIQEGGDHYKRVAVEPWDVFDTWPVDQRIGAYRANCTKYIMRLDAKDTPLLNAKKLAHYSQKLVEVLEEVNRG